MPNREAYKDAIKHGLCGFLCGNETTLNPKTGKNFSLCEKCLGKNRDRILAKMKYRRSIGICPYCNEKAQPGLTQCKRHAQMHGKHVYDELLAENRCGRCATKKTEDDIGHVICIECRAYLRKHIKEVYLYNKKRHKCVRCQKTMPQAYKFIRCPKCSEYRKKHK